MCAINLKTTTKLGKQELQLIGQKENKMESLKNHLFQIKSDKGDKRDQKNRKENQKEIADAIFKPNEIKDCFKCKMIQMPKLRGRDSLFFFFFKCRNI